MISRLTLYDFRICCCRKVTERSWAYYAANDEEGKVLGVEKEALLLLHNGPKRRTSFTPQSFLDLPIPARAQP